MNVRDLTEDDRVPGVRFDPTYLRRAKAGGMYVGLVAEDGGHVYGAAEAGILLHTTRGPALRTRFISSRVSQTFRPLLETMCDRARDLGCKALYVMSAPHAPELCTAAMIMKFARINGDFSMSRRNVPTEAVEIPGVIIRAMHVDEYPEVRRRLISLVSGGDRSVSAPELRQFLASGLFVPYVAEVDGELVACAELDVFHTVLANCRVGRVERVAVHPDWRGRGISRALVAELLRQSSLLGCEKVDLLVRDGNVPAIRTYDRLGFVRTNEIPYWLAL